MFEGSYFTICYLVVVLENVSLPCYYFPRSLSERLTHAHPDRHFDVKNTRESVSEEIGKMKIFIKKLGRKGYAGSLKSYRKGERFSNSPFMCGSS